MGYLLSDCRLVACDLSSGGNSVVEMKRFNPTPITEALFDFSTRIPAIFFSETYRSFGHLMQTGATQRGSITWPIATAASAVRKAGSLCGLGGESTRDISKLLEAGANHSRPRRPRPLVCSSARKTVPFALSV